MSDSRGSIQRTVTSSHSIQPKRKTLEEFVRQAIAIHGNRYDYSKVKYINTETKVEIICSVHGSFWITPHNHLGQNHGCPKCGRTNGAKKRADTTEGFIQKAVDVHGQKYDYFKVVYKKRFAKIEIVCPIHGSFWQTAGDHLSGYGCPKCGIEKNADRIRLTQSDFIERAKRAHGNRYDYSKVAYIGNKRKVEIVCPEHGPFWMAPGNHIDQQQGCPECGREIRIEKRTWTKERFIQEAQKIHGDRYYYSQVEYRKSNIPVEVICPIHGSFFPKPNNHLSSRTGCPHCAGSKSEDFIAQTLTEWGIEFTRQKTFEGLKSNKKYLRYDFYFQIGKIHFLLEYDGYQHFEPVPAWGGEESLREIQRRDTLKTRFAQRYNFTLIRISEIKIKKIRIALRSEIEKYTGQPLERIPKHTRYVGGAEINPGNYQQGSLFNT